jgi:hypothetical protein
MRGLAAEFLDVGATVSPSARGGLGHSRGSKKKRIALCVHFQMNIVPISSVPTSNVWSHRRDDKLGFMTPPPQNTLTWDASPIAVWPHPR